MSWPGLCVLGSDRAWFCGHWGAHEFFDGRSIALYSGHLLPSEPHGQTQSSHLFLLWDSLEGTRAGSASPGCGCTLASKALVSLGVSEQP